MQVHEMLAKRREQYEVGYEFGAFETLFRSGEDKSPSDIQHEYLDTQK